ncbi:MAG TPA: serine/threonine-protein kinase, partial [Gemmataceae bacterium]|nr:serine/threonine-protein kinase [Gemmataceae bacterium]
MPQTRCCPACGAPSAPDAADGVCPSCRQVNDPAESGNTIVLDSAAPTLPPGAPPAAAHTEGAALPEQFGRYRMLKTLGEGGMGSVYLAHDTQLDRQVALKVPHFRPEDGRSALERFKREARAAAALIHPNICPVYDVGETNGMPYLTMGFIEGRTLAELLRNGKTFTQRQIAFAVRKVALALQEAHQRGIVHRDLKPSNIMINQRGEPVVMDFGLAQQTAAGDVRLTQSGLALGTPAYMSPEQANGDLKAMGPGCDVYSLGVILYELLTRQVPFAGTAMTILMQIACDEPVPPSERRPGIDPRLEAICLKAMAKKPEERFASMSAMAVALADYIRSAVPSDEPPPAVLRTQASDAGIRESVMGGFRSAAQAAYQLAATRTQPREAPPARRIKKRRRRLAPWLWSGAGLAALLAAAVPIYYLTRPKPARTDAPTLANTITVNEQAKVVPEKVETGKTTIREEKTKTIQPPEITKKGKGPGKRRDPVVSESRIIGQVDQAVIALALSPDGRFALGGSRDGNIRLWEVASGKLLHTFTGHDRPVLSVAFAPRGHHALSCAADNSIRLWDIDNHKLIRVFEHVRPATIFNCVAFSPDGRQAISAANDRTLRLWNVATGKQLGLSISHPDRVMCAAYSSDGRMVATGCWDHNIYVWDQLTGRLRGAFKGHKGPVLSVAFSPDDRQVLSGSLDTSLKLWD